jgi:predicted DNA-binding transcriptional regulator YafY
MLPILPVLIAAIEGHHLVSLWYDPGVRVVEPYVLGYGSDDQALLRAFQVWGASASGRPIDWKLFRLDRIRDAKLNGRRFRRPRPNYQRDDSAMTRGIITQL